MNQKSGVWHTTSVQAAQQNQQRYQTRAAAGQKRSIHDLQVPSIPGRAEVESGRKPPPPPRPTLAVGSPRLTASTILNVDAAREGPSEYTQRQKFAATPTSTVDPLLSLSHPSYGLPRELVANFATLGIKIIYPWQKQCLSGPGLLRGERNLVYSAPTGGGKSLVADVLMLKRVFEDREAKAILVLPYVALVQEKVRWLRNIVNGISREKHLGQKLPEGNLWATRADKDTLRVVGFYSGTKIKSTWADFDIAVCTIEKVRGHSFVKCFVFSPDILGKLVDQHGHRRSLHTKTTRCRPGRVPHDRRRIPRLPPRTTGGQAPMP